MMNDSEEHLRAMLASQSELVGSLTHDLKGLLTGIEGGLYMVDSGRSKGNEQRINQGFEMLRRNLARMKRAVSNALYYVKDREMNWLPIDIRTLTKSVSDALTAQAGHPGAELVVRSEEGTFEGDEVAIRSLLVDLAEYLLDSCRLAKLSPTPSVTLSARLRDESADFELVAQGFLIDDEVTENALDAYYSARAGDKAPLLLYIAHKLIKTHGGSLEIRALADQQATRCLVRIPKHRIERAH
jgi:signal transduction histidine kinase